MRLEWMNACHALSPGGVVIERSSLTAIGELGCKSDPDASGAVEIGYGLNPSVWNRGYATEIVSAFTAWLLEQPTVRTVTAETATSNPASARVLEKSGFVRMGTSWNEDDGSLILWQRRA
jgi:[ribosomal protein S5]-alanine N-acetyltransferase